MSKGLKITIGVVLLVIVGIVAYVFFILKGSSSHLNFVPKNSVMVGVIDLKHIGSKLDIEKLKNLQSVKYLAEQNKNEAKNDVFDELMKNPTGVGIDPFSKLCLFTKTESELNVTYGFVAHLISEKDFEGMVSKLKVKNSITDNNTFKSLQIENNVVLAWTKDAALFLVSTDSSQLAANCAKIMSQKKDESIASNDDFLKLYEKSFDMASYINYEALTALTKQGAALNPLSDQNSKDALKGSYGECFINFEENKISSVFNSIIKDKAAFEKIDYLNTSGLNAKHIQSISPDKIYAILSASLNFKKLVSIIKSNPNYQMGITALKTQLNISDAELENLLTGEISLAMVDFNDFENTAASGALAGTPSKEETEANPAQPAIQTKSPGFALNLSVGDKKVIDKLLAGLGLIQTPEGFYTIPAGYMSFQLVQTDNGVCITNSKTLATQLSAQKIFKMPVDPVKSIVSNNPLGLYLDLNLKNYPAPFLEQLKKNIGEENYPKFTSIMNNFSHFSSKFNSGNGTTDLIFTPGEGNTLMRLILSMDQLTPKK